MGTHAGIPRFMIDSSIMFCSCRSEHSDISEPVTIYTAKRDGTFVARCYSIPGFVVKGETFDRCNAG